MTTANTPLIESIEVQGAALTATIKQLLHDGNIRRIVVKNQHGHTIIEIPVTAGIVAFIAAPVLTAVAAIAALAKNYQIDIHRTHDVDLTA